MITDRQMPAVSALFAAALPSVGVQAAPPRDSDACPLTYNDHWSVQAEYSQASGLWVARTPAGDMDTDGGLLALRDY